MTCQLLLFIRVSCHLNITFDHIVLLYFLSYQSCLITSACEGGTSNITTSRVSRNLLCEIVACMSSASQMKVGDILWGMYFKISSTTVECESNFNEEESHHEYGNNSDSRGDKAFYRNSRRGSHVGHLRAVALTIRHYLSIMKLATVNPFLTKITELLDFNSQGKHPIKSVDTDSNILKNSSGNIELLLDAIPFTILLNRCKNEKATNDLESWTVSGQEGRHQRMTHDLLTVLLSSSLTLMDARETESKTRSNESCRLGHGAVLGVTMLSNLFLNYDGNFITSKNSDIKSTMQAVVNHSSPKTSLTALKKRLLQSIEAISKYFMGLSTNSRNGHCSIRTAAQYKKINCCFNALLRLTKALGSILEIASEHFNGGSSTRLKMQNSQREREKVNHTVVELTENDINILTACASATLSVSNILTTAWTIDQDALRLLSISKSVESVCKIILINVNFFPREIFEASRSLFPLLISNALALSKCYQMTITPIQESDVISVIHLKTGMKIASMWSHLLSCLLTFAKKLPPSLQSSVPSLVPQKVIFHIIYLTNTSSHYFNKFITSVSHILSIIPCCTYVRAGSHSCTGCIKRFFRLYI